MIWPWTNVVTHIYPASRAEELTCKINFVKTSIYFTVIIQM